jgi:DNA polymerase-3 subunit alpha
VYSISRSASGGDQDLPPDINESLETFTVVGGKIRFGLGAIKNVGEAAIRSIIGARKDGPFVDLLDFCRRVDLRQVNKRVVENLLLAGCFDSLGITRREALSIMEETLELANGYRDAQTVTRCPIRGDSRFLCSGALSKRVPSLDLLAEKDVLGFMYRQILWNSGGNTF